MEGISGQGKKTGKKRARQSAAAKAVEQAKPKFKRGKGNVAKVCPLASSVLPSRDGLNTHGLL